MGRLKPEELRAVCDPAGLPFRSTEELSPLDVMIGQKRALGATSFGIGVPHHGYNLFALGPSVASTRRSRVFSTCAARAGSRVGTA